MLWRRPETDGDALPVHAFSCQANGDRNGRYVSVERSDPIMAHLSWKLISLLKALLITLEVGPGWVQMLASCHVDVRCPSLSGFHLKGLHGHRMRVHFLQARAFTYMICQEVLGKNGHLTQQATRKGWAAPSLERAPCHASAPSSEAGCCRHSSPAGVAPRLRIAGAAALSPNTKQTAPSDSIAERKATPGEMEHHFVSQQQGLPPNEE